MLAEIVEVPVLTPLAEPLELMVATEGFEELHNTWLLMLITEPSLNVPFAVNVWAVPVLIDAFEGVTAIESSVAFVTVSDAVPTCPLNTAEIVTFPG